MADDGIWQRFLCVSHLFSASLLAPFAPDTIGGATGHGEDVRSRLRLPCDGLPGPPTGDRRAAWCAALRLLRFSLDGLLRLPFAAHRTRKGPALKFQGCVRQVRHLRGGSVRRWRLPVNPPLCMLLCSSHKQRWPCAELFRVVAGAGSRWWCGPSQRGAVRPARSTATSWVRPNPSQLVLLARCLAL